MSEQQPLYHQNSVNIAPGSRLNDQPQMSVPYLVYLKAPERDCPRTQNSAPRIETMNLNSGTLPVANPAYYSYCMRPPEPYPAMFRAMHPSIPTGIHQVYYPNMLQRNYVEPPINNQMVDYTAMGFPSQQYPAVYQQSTPYQIPVSAPGPRQPIVQVPVCVPPRIPSVTKPRLKIVNPNTGGEVDLEHDTPSHTGTTVTVPNDRTDIPKPIIQQKSLIVSSAPSNQEVKDETDVAKPSDELHDTESSNQTSVDDTHIFENGSVPDRTVPKTVLDDVIGDSADEAVEEESDTDDPNDRRVYPRDFLIRCRDSPVCSVPLTELAAYFADYSRPRKGTRNANRSAQQRIIRLPTGITVKRVVGAFVPSHLRKKEEGENDHQKVLSRELNVILNRVSDGNMSETVGDLKKLRLSTPDDLEILAKLVFQKSIRQPKYSKVFANLCKELKGFDVPGSESFESLIFKQTQELFQTPLEALISELNTALDAKIAAAEDEAVKRVLEDGRDTNIVKKTEAYYGNISFLAELFLCGLVPSRTMTKCLNELKDSPKPESLNSMLILLRTCGQELEQQAKSIVENCFSRLNTHMKSTKLPTHQIYKIQELIEMRERGWKEIDQMVSAPDVPSKRQDDRGRRTFQQPPPEPRRKPIELVNSVTPSKLAVTQQTSESYKLGPTKSDWSQGSGQLGRNSNDRGSNPRMSNVHAPAHCQPGRSFAHIVTPKDDNEEVLERCAKLARSVLATLQSNEDSMYIFSECKDQERTVLVQKVLERSMEGKSNARDLTGILFLGLLNKPLLQPTDLFSACNKYLQTCDDDWLEDYPRGWLFLAEVFQHFIQAQRDYFKELFNMLAPLKSEGRAASVLAHCLRLSSQRLGEECVAAKFQSLNRGWIELQVRKEDLEDFLTRHSVQFTMSADPFEPKLKELNDLAANRSSTQDDFTLWFKRISKPDLPLNSVRSCAKTLISKSINLTRPQIDQRVTGLGLLVDHQADREAQVLAALHECSISSGCREFWQKSLLDKKVISTEAWDSWTKSHNCVSQPLPSRNK